MSDVIEEAELKEVALGPSSSFLVGDKNVQSHSQAGYWVDKDCLRPLTSKYPQCLQIPPVLVKGFQVLLGSSESGLKEYGDRQRSALRQAKRILYYVQTSS